MSSSYAIPVPLLPPGTKPLCNQVAGHRYGEGKTKLGCLQHEDGTMLKPVQAPVRGQREVDFYKAVYSERCSDETLLAMRNFMPHFYGIVRCSVNANEKKPKKKKQVKYLKLENVIEKFKNPCVVDIKIGKQTYDPEASPEKIAAETAKFPPLEKLGYQLSGMQAYDPVKQKIVKYDKYYCKKLFEDTMITQGLGKFFLIDSGLRKDVLKLVIDKLKKLEAWFLSQKKFAFYASSILIVWEGDMNHKQAKSEVSDSSDVKVNVSSEVDNSSEMNDDTNNDYNNKEDSADKITENGRKSVEREENITNSQTDTRHLLDGILIDSQEEDKLPVVDVRMIDFAHVFETDENDSNYLFGIQNLIKHMEILQKMPS